jgi:hypothetical protein
MNEELPPSERPPAQRPPQDEKGAEKTAEKEREKTEEKAVEEKPRYYEEKYRRDPISGMFWAALLILAGMVFLAENFNVLPKVAGREVESWVWILFGAGVLVLLEAAVRLASPDYRLPTTGRFIWGGMLMLIAVGLAIGNFDVVWPLVLVIIGLAILLRGIIR